MKKLVAFMLVLSLLTGFTACNKTQQISDPSTEEGTTQPLEASHPNVTVQQLPMVCVSLPVVTQDYCADDGAVIYKHTNQNISLIVPDPEVADKVILDFLNRTDLQDTVDSVYSSATGAYADAIMSKALPYWTQITYSPTRIDSGVLSLFGSFVQYSGGAHPMESAKTVNYDLVTGNTLSLTDILTENSDTDTLCLLVLKALESYQNEMSFTLYDGYEATVTELFKKPLEEITNWYLTSEGLSFAFSPYEIGAYTYGIIPASIPYADLTGILRDAYFPTERDITSGTVNAEIFDAEKLDNLTQFAEVVIDQAEQAILLTSGSMLYNVQIMTGHWNDGKTDFIIEHTVLRASSLTPGDGIMVQGDPGCICIQYTTAEGVKTAYPVITNGTITLQ